MARIRTIKPDFFQSEDVAVLSYRSRLTWIGLWTYVDDAGRCKDNARLIKGHVWPLEDDVTAKEVEADLAELSQQRRIIRYEVDGEKFIQVSKWLNHQRISKPSPSKLPEPLPNHSGRAPGNGREASTTPQNRENTREDDPSATLPVVLPESSANIPTPLPVGSGSGKGSGSGSGEGDPGKPDARKTITPEHRAATAAYEETGKALNFMAVRGIAKWAIHERGLSEEDAAAVMVAAYRDGKPIIKSVIGQMIDGYYGNRSSSDRRLQKGMELVQAAEQREFQPSEFPAEIANDYDTDPFALEA